MALCHTKPWWGAEYVRVAEGHINGISYAVRAEDTVLETDGEKMCAIFSVAYLAAGENRPVLFAFNGGPGSPSAWLHFGLFGPRIAACDADGMPPARPPYALRDNPDCLVDLCDIVLYDPPGAGCSRVFDEKFAEKCFGDHADADVAAAFIRAWLEKHGCANRPVYICGESFGSTRASLLAYRLRDLDLRGIIHIGPGYTGDELIPRTLKDLVPAAATKWYYDESADKPPLEILVARVRNFLENEYVPALYRGGLLSEAEKRAVADKLAAFTGLPADYYLKNGLKVVRAEFREMLLRDRGLRLGSFDTRFAIPLAEKADAMLARFDPCMDACAHEYLSNELGLDTGRAYRGSSFDEDDSFGWPFDAEIDMQGLGGVYSKIGMTVSQAAAEAYKANPRLHFLFATGCFDTVATVENTRFGVTHTDVPLAAVTMLEYPSGHAVYADDASRRALAKDIRNFIGGTMR
jgi:carboxypeptidase C (cathepsin A)